MNVDITRKASIIIPCTRPKSVRKTIDSLLAQVDCLEDYEIIVIGKLLPDFRQIYKNDKIILVKTPELFPPSKARNLGAQRAKEDILIFIDDDCEAISGLIDSYLSFFGKKRIGAVTGKIIGKSKKFFSACLDYSNFYSHLSDKEKEVDRFISATFAIRKDLFNFLKGFDEDIFGEEEIELAARIKKAGFLIVYSPCIAVIHNHNRDTFSKMIKYHYKSGLSAGLSLSLRHRDNLKTKIKFRLRHYYIFMIIPFTVWSVQKALREVFKLTKKAFLYAPFIFINHLSYQLGVFKWTLTLSESRSGRI
ncbi:MAG: glycosyltransferase [Candidatus Omnitrophica bacterium]|nr:glycosyltransferase [Candidatus Omnitrophota bacterium]MDD5429416.1 glycosyltransferase [Candidatus Omnitrophota bacterium]